MKIDRLLAITILLINRKRITARELAERFEVSVRTIHRDIESINMAGIPVSSFQGTHGGFGIVDGYRLDRSVLTGDEINSIITALKSIKTTLDDRTIEAALEKIMSMSSTFELEKTNRIGGKITIDFNSWGCGARQKSRISLVKKAVEDNRLLRFTYTNAKGESLRRVVEPASIAFKGYAWYLDGYCREREGRRFFKLTRIKDLELLEERFIPRDFQDNDGGNDWEWSGAVNPVELLMRFRPSARVRVEDFYEEEMTETLEDGSIMVRVSYPEDEWVYGHILSFGDEVEVVEPPHIREIIRERAKNIWKKYS